ncbi:helix-turn-helix domain-containing protein [Bacillus carboniphilus]|uniref:Helix-turn-helix domain-containing protein n=1 Tax=Bacillus carboniphilus TaxID=86663 RepID=A0ABY9JRG4_9BACI|nr:helix-turn-helix domain-containing protein [Bacillus carboniphilus]WLR41318.1 helix-turn-helix domain-containing protein [Bacillus carboniphilus]
MFGLGKSRTKFGRWLDKQEDINQLKLEKASQLGRPTISKLCNDKDYKPKYSTIVKINKGLNKLGKDIDVEKFL